MRGANWGLAVTSVKSVGYIILLYISMVLHQSNQTKHHATALFFNELVYIVVCSFSLVQPLCWSVYMHSFILSVCNF